MYVEVEIQQEVKVTWQKGRIAAAYGRL